MPTVARLQRPTPKARSSFAVIAVAKPAHQGGGEGVDDHEGDAEDAVLAVVEVKLALDDLADGEEDVAVDVVQEVHAEQDGQGVVGAWERFGGRSVGSCRGERGARAQGVHSGEGLAGSATVGRNHGYTVFGPGWGGRGCGEEGGGGVEIVIPWEF